LKNTEDTDAIFPSVIPTRLAAPAWRVFVAGEWDLPPSPVLAILLVYCDSK